MANGGRIGYGPDKSNSGYETKSFRGENCPGSDRLWVDRRPKGRAGAVVALRLRPGTGWVAECRATAGIAPFFFVHPQRRTRRQRLPGHPRSEERRVGKEC